MGSPNNSLSAELIGAHAPFVRALARALVLDRELADDLAQDVLVAALEEGPREGRACRAWLATTLRHLASKAFRSRTRRTARERAVARPMAAVLSPAEILAREDVRRRLVEHVLALDEPVRAVMILRYLEDLAPREVARRLGQPVETVRTRAKRGLALLRAKLHAEPERERSWKHLGALAGLRLPALDSLPSAAFTAGACFWGAMLMSLKKLVLVVSCLVLLGFVGLRFLPGAASPEPPELAAAPEQTLQQPQDRVAAPQAEAGERTVLAAGEQPPPPAAPQPVSTTGSLLLRVQWHDGSPAANVAARLHLPPPADFYRDTRDVLTDMQGSARVDALPPGTVSLWLDRAIPGGASIEAGASAELVLKIPAGIQLSGRVLTPAGVPVADASIFVDSSGNGSEAHELARSGPDGRYSIRSVGDGVGWISARAPLHAPSLQRQFIAGVVDLEGQDLVLQPTGSAVEGRVLGSDGLPFAAATLIVGDEDSLQRARLPDGSPARVPAAQRAESDAQGRFVVAGVAPGVHTLGVRARGHAPWTGQIEVAEGAKAWREVRLERASTLRGRVIDTSGMPIARAEVLANGNYGFAACHGRCAADGSFRLEGLPAGEFEVELSAEGYEPARARLLGAPGAELEWQPVLAARPKIRARLVASGADFSGWWVTSEAHAADGEPFRSGAVPAADGTFTLDGAGAGVAHTVNVHAPGAFFPSVVLENVRAGPDELAISIEAGLLLPCALRGRLMDSSGRPLAGLSFSIAREGVPIVQVHTSAADGTFEQASLPPGRYRVIVRETGFAPFKSELVELANGATRDLGDLRLDAGGRIVVRMRRDAGLEDAAVGVQAEQVEGSQRFRLFAQGEEARSETLAEGSYAVRLTQPAGTSTVALRSVRAFVRAGEDTTVELRIEAGRSVALDCRPDDGGALLIHAFDAQGALLAELRTKARAELRLPAATVRLELRDEKGRSITTSLATSQGPEPVSLTLELR